MYFVTIHRLLVDGFLRKEQEMGLFLEDNEVDIIVFSNELLLLNYVSKAS